MKTSRHSRFAQAFGVIDNPPDPLTCPHVELRNYLFLTRGTTQPLCRDCDPAAHHRWNCSATPAWAQTMRETDTNPWTAVSPARFSWLDFNWVWNNA